MNPTVTKRSLTSVSVRRKLGALGAEPVREVCCVELKRTSMKLELYI